MTLCDVFKHVELYILELENTLKNDRIATFEKMDTVDREDLEDEVKRLKDGMCKFDKLMKEE